jgi:hypothetical protein
MTLLKIGGILSALVFGYMEKRADDYWRHYMDRACALEEKLGYSQYSTRPVRKLRTTHTILVLYGTIALF